jgi:F-type H+-transporting ATPase subunit a
MTKIENPLNQFAIRTIVPIHIGQYDVSFTNASLLMLIAFGVIVFLFFVGTSRKAVVPGRLQGAAEMIYEFTANMVEDNAGHGSAKYVPFVMSVFLLVLFGNILGLVPYSFTFTSQIIVTIAMALMIFVVVVLLSLKNHGFGFFKMFFPPGAPIFLAPLLIPIEVLSFVFRPISLAVRLFANMMAGHVMLQLFAGFTILMGIFGVLPFTFVVLLTGFEILVALLQAYVFALLTSIYLKDTLETH